MKRTRRQFARDAALLAAAALSTRAFGDDSEDPASAPAPAPQTPSPSPPWLAKASAEEARLRAEAIFHKYPGRFSPAQQAAIRAESQRLQVSLDELRHCPLDDADVPATVFRPTRPARRP